MEYSEMTTDELKAELESTKKNFDFKDETWHKILQLKKNCTLGTL